MSNLDNCYIFCGGPHDGQRVVTTKPVRSIVNMTGGSYHLFEGIYYRWQKKRGRKAKPQGKKHRKPNLYLKGRRAALIDNGKCISCRRPRGETSSEVFCQPCLESHREYHRERYRRLKRERQERGECTLCRSPRGESSSEVFCQRCADRKKAQNQRSRENRKSTK